MIHSICIEGFKAFRDRQILPLAPVTLLYGPNAAGKSSVIQAVLFLKQSLAAKEVSPRGRLVDLGSFQTLVHQHNLKRSVRIGTEFASPNLESILSGSRGIITCTFGVANEGRFCAPVVTDVAYQLSNNRLDTHIRRLPSTPNTPPGPWCEPPDYELSDEASVRSLAEYAESCEHSDLPWSNAKREWLLRFLRDNKISSRRPELLPSYVRDPLDRWIFNGESDYAARQAVPFDTVVAGLQIIGILNDELIALCQTIRHLGPHRAKPERYSPISDSVDEYVGSLGERTALVLSRLDQLGGQDQINEWFNRLSIPYALRLRRIADDVVGEFLRLTLVDRRTSTRVSPADVGFGVGQILPILVQSLVPSEPETELICVEQPELHLHPRLQAEIAEIFLASAGLGPHARKDRAPMQWLIETHSENLLLRIQRRIRSGSICAQDICVLYVQPSRNGSQIMRLRLDDNGEFTDEWPDGFFEEGFREAFGD